MKIPKDLTELSLRDQVIWYRENFQALLDEYDALQEDLKFKSTISVQNLKYNKELQSLLVDLVDLILDPNGLYYKNSKEDIFKRIEEQMSNKVAVLYNEGVVGKDRQFDGILEVFALGTGGKLSSWDREKDTNNPLLIRGLGGDSRKAIKHCWETGRDFYAVDTGYLGNDRYKTKVWHRVTKNNLQHLGPVIERPTDRLEALKYKFKKFRSGRKILICPPSAKVMMLWDQPSPEEWTQQVIKNLKQYTDRPIEVRLKPNRTERTTNKSIWSALDDDVHCLITYNSIAATEAILYGKPAIALGPNAAQVICSTSLSEVERLRIPTEDEVVAFAAHLSYCQFNLIELQNGTAWRMLNESN